MHDAVRGSGVFDRVRRNLELIRERRGKLIFLTTVSDANVAELAELPEQLAELGPDEIVLQQLMYLTPVEIAAYRKFSVENFGCDYPELEAWRREDDAAYLAMLRRQLAALAKRSHPVPVRFTPHSYPDRLPDAPACQGAVPPGAYPARRSGRLLHGLLRFLRRQRQRAAAGSDLPKPGCGALPGSRPKRRTAHLRPLPVEIAATLICRRERQPPLRQISGISPSAYGRGEMPILRNFSHGVIHI